MKREESRIEDTWRMEDMFSSDGAWEELYREVKERISEYEKYKGKLEESADLLYECLTFDDLCSLDIERLFVYARQKSDEDTTNSNYQEFAGRAATLSVSASAISSFLIPEILNMDEERLKGFLRSDNGIGLYSRMIEMIEKKRDHMLTAELEKLMADSIQATQGASQIFNMFNNADIKFPVIEGPGREPVQITHGNFVKLLESRDRGVRKAAFEGLYESYAQFRNTLAAVCSANIKQAVFYAKARKYTSVREYYLTENEIPVQVYDNLVKAVRESLPTLHRYMEIRKRLLQVEELHIYDLYTPLIEYTDKDYTFEEAKTLTKEGLEPLGEDYGRVLAKGYENRWIDVYENEGKRSGAYSWGAYGTHPYVLLNFNGTLNHVFTLAHEMGHALHSYYSDQAQPYPYAGYKIFVAEVASTCNEALLIRHLLSKASARNEKAYLINHFLESFRATVFRQTMFAEFEQMVHEKAWEGEEFTAGKLCEMYHRLNVEYFGPAVIVDSQIDLEWGRIPHFYTPFYVYQYATGFSAAVAISSKILSGDREVAEGYRTFLCGGCSLPPIDLLRLCGVDMRRPDPVREALNVFECLLNELEQCL